MTTSDGDAAETTGMAAEEEDAKPEALQPCFVCGRKFNPSSLGKHVAICERTGQRKRKPFDSSKQRIKGTELADFLPKRQLEQQQHQQQSPSQSQQQQHHASGTEPTTRARAGQQQQQQQQAGDEAAGKPWKQSRDELLRAIRAARGDDGPHAHGHQHNQSASTQHQHHHQQQQQQHQHHQHQRPSNLSLVTSPGAPKRSYEKGQCPTCQREFGLKSYERHVAFCRERATRLPASPQTCSSVAKERLEARMKYRAPGLRGRKPTNREKYSPGAPRPGGATGASPLLARSPTKEAAGATTTTTTTTRQGAGGGEPASPKLPTLKRQGQSTKDSPITSNGPLKSRPIDRSNRTPEPQIALNPPNLRQLFTTRRLFQFSEVLPSKILHTKMSLSSSSSQKSSARATTNSRHKEIADSPLESPKSIEYKIKKKIKFKTKAREQKKPIIEEEKQKMTEELEPNVEQGQDYLTWNQICEDAHKSNVIDSIEKEEEPFLSDLTGLSSLDEGNSTNDERENKKQISSRSKEQQIAIKVDDNDTSLTLDQTYVIQDTEKMDDLMLENEDSSHTIVNNNRSTPTICDSDDNADGLSTASMKTFRKSDRKTDEVDFMDDPESCKTEHKDVSVESKDEKNTSAEDVEQFDNCDTERVEAKHTLETSEIEESTKAMRDKLLVRPKLCCSMPNMERDTDSETPRVNKVSAHNKREEGNILEWSSARDHDEVKNALESSEEPQCKDARISTTNCTSRRCATYVIHKHRRDSSPSQCPEDPSQIGDDEPCERKQSKRRRRKLSQQQQQSRWRLGDSSDGAVASKNDLATTTNDPWPAAPGNKAAADAPAAAAAAAASSAATVESRPSLAVLDYYRNERANFSDASSVRTSDQLMMLDLDEDFAYDSESNASELIKEIEVSQPYQLGPSFVGDNEESLMSLASRIKGIELARGVLGGVGRAGKLENKARKSRNVRYEEETSSSIVDETPRSGEEDGYGLPRRARHYDKEICTITRLEPTTTGPLLPPPLARQDTNFLPSINERIGAAGYYWRGRLEYRSERLVPSSTRLGGHRGEGRAGPAPPMPPPGPAPEDGRGAARAVRHGLRATDLKLPHLDRRSLLRRSFERLPRSDWNNYVRRHPDFSMILRGRIGLGNEYNPFLLAEQQLNELFSDTSDQSSVDAPSLSTPQKPNSSPSCPLARPSAFAKYPLTQNSPQSPLQSPSQFQQQVANNHSDKQLQRASVIAPPTGFDDLTSSDLSSDCTETNSLSREIQTSSSNSSVLPASHVQGEREHVLGRRVIIDQNQALGGGEFAPSKDSQQQQQQQHQKQQQPSKMSNGSHSKLTRPSTMSNGNGCNRSSSMRAASAPKPPERKNSSSSSSGSSDFFCSKKPGQSSLGRSQLTSGSNDNNNKLGNNYKSLNGSNLSLNSIISTTDLEMKRSNSLFDELLSSFEDEANTGSALPSLMSLMRNEPSLSLLSSAAQQNGINGHHQHQRIAGNGRLNCSDDDAELSSPESVKRQECGGKLSADSAYSSLNRKYSSHQDRGCHDANSKLKLSKFCHECGFKFPDSAKFCCECGAKRLTL